MKTKAAMLIYQNKSEPHEFHAVYVDDAQPFDMNKKQWDHVATIDPALWIEYLLNHPEENQEQIEGPKK